MTQWHTTTYFSGDLHIPYKPEASEKLPHTTNHCSFPINQQLQYTTKQARISFSIQTRKFESANWPSIKSMKNLQCAVYDSGHTKPSMWLQAKATIQRPNSTDKTITNAIGRSEASTAFILRWEGERGTYKVDRVDLPHQSINTCILNIDRDWEQ